ncbi:MAG: DUF4922 domain-containing protein [Ignavibacteriales bacterium]|nr:DUF4922 domain-containing protein [Ignavibacteriales bacterium]
MIEKRIISEEELKPFLDSDTIADKTKALLSQQKKVWKLPKEGYKSLEKVQVKVFEFDGFQIKVQFNPGRIISSSAKVDKKSIENRKCFLCIKNLSPEQKGILYYRDLIILVNPYPIFPEHFTLPKIDHIPQAIEPNFEGLLDISRDLSKHYIVFYNGPKCGASAPDHFHYQAGLKYFMPIDSEYPNIIKQSAQKLVEENGSAVYAVDKYLRNFISIESNNKDFIKKYFNKFFDIYKKISPSDEEPMLNIISNYEQNKWRVIIFPRAKHRPYQYFAEGDGNILLSPAAVDFGGVFITPLEKDFNKISKDDIIDIFRQTSISTEYFEFIKKELAKNDKKCLFI